MTLRGKLVDIALEWQDRFGVAPSITSAISEYDAAMLIGMVPKASNYEWDKLIWILYDKEYIIQEAWEWSVQDYKIAFDRVRRLSPKDYRKGITVSGFGFSGNPGTHYWG